MVPRTRLILAFLLVAIAGLVPSARAYIDLGIRPIWRDEASDLAPLTMEDRLARIDDLEAPLRRGESIDDSTRVELIELYRMSPLMKHRVIALQYADHLEGTQRLRQRVLTMRRTFNPWDAGEALEEWSELEPHNAEPVRRRAIQFFEEGLLGLADSDSWFDRSAEAFAKATTLDGASVDDWRGWAVALIGARRLDELRPVADALLDVAPDAPGSYLISALAYEAQGAENRAALDFEAALSRMDAQTRYGFGNPSNFVVPDAPFADELVRQAPPADDRGWWIRLIEVETLFARPGEGINGWDTSVGQIYLKYGRPEFMRAFRFSSREDVLATPELTPYHAHIEKQLNSTPRGLDKDQRFWVWLIRISDDRLFPVVFGQLTEFAPWQLNEVADIDLLQKQKGQGPFRLPTSLPHVPSTAPVTLDVKITGFRETAGRLRIEAWSATRPRSDVDPGAVRLRILGIEGQEIDRDEKPFDEAHHRGHLAGRLDSYPEGVAGWVHGFGALLPPSEYLVIVDVLDDTGKVIATRDRRVGFDAKQTEPSGFGISELLLCDVYEQTAAHRDLAPEFVRYARVVIPHPEPALHPGQREVSVYYEVYGAVTDPEGRARLRIEYEVFPARGFNPYLGGAGYVDGKLAVPVIDTVFEDERTGTTTGGRVIRGTRLRADEVGPGDYVLVVRVSDRLARKEAQNTVRFEVPAPAER